MKAYFVATANDIKSDKLGWIDWGKGHRVVGWYPSLKKAIEAVEENHGDIYEYGFYKYAIIEGLEPGLYPDCFNPIFYKWEGSIESGGYKKIERPEATNGFCNFTIG